MIRVLIADDNPIIRSGLTSLVSSAPDLEVVGEAATGRQAIEVAESVRPDVVLLDVRMPVMDGVTAAAVLQQHTTVLMLTYSDDVASVTGAIRNGAAGYLIHGEFDADELFGAIRDVSASRPALSATVVPTLLAAVRDDGATPPPALGLRGGDHRLTPREAEVMDRMSAGRTNTQIAEELFLAPKTVKNTINRVYAKLGVGSRGEAIAQWVGTADPDDLA